MHRDRSLARGLRRILLPVAIAAVASIGAAGPAAAQSPDLLRRLNDPWARVADARKSSTRIFTAYLDMTKPPVEVGESFNQNTIYAGMEDFEAVARWAEANSSMGKTLLEVQDCLVLGVPYGTDGIDARFVERGLAAEIVAEGDVLAVRLPYLKAFESINAYVAADMYRLCEAGRFEEALTLGVAHLKVLRQGVEGTMFDEKQTFMRMLCDALAVHRDVVYTYMQKMGADLLRRFATREYPYLKPSDNERLKRIAMPEGDLLVGGEVIRGVFGSDGQPDLEKFARVFADIQADDAPLTAFGASKRWSKIAGVHGSLEASEKKLTDVYDDWWRRWRMRPYDPLFALPTELSRTNPVRYAAVLLVARDIESLFELRRRLTVEWCGTVVGTGLAAYRMQLGVWPDKIEKAYTQFFPRRFDFDPYDRELGRLQYTFLGTRKRGVESEFGRVEATGCLLYARNGDNVENGASRHAPGGNSDDFVVWPPLRAISRGAE